MPFDIEMQRALQADAEKLRQLGADVADPQFLYGLDHAGDVIVDSCRYCGCTEDLACQLEDAPYACSWYRQPDHRGLGVCSAPECVRAYLADRSAP